jgi:hypothetical protein
MQRDMRNFAPLGANGREISGSRRLRSDHPPRFQRFLGCLARPPSRRRLGMNLALPAQ